VSRRSEEPDSIDRIEQGDPDAWKELCEKYGEPLFRYAYHLTRDSSAACDVRQATLLAAVQNIAAYRRKVPLFAWLCGIARHKAADEVRRRECRHIPLETVTEETWRRLSSEPLPDELLERAETQAAVVEALWSLPEDYREALVSRYVHGESVQELATRLGRTYKAAESILSRARESFLRQLKGEFRDE
jgi:RNA polymerase sigma-70 factor (ECF subfamily)